MKLWLAQQREEILQPELSIVDPHHHLWSHAGNVYLFPELLADLSSGHKIRATVFEEWGVHLASSAEMRPDSAAGRPAPRKRTRRHRYVLGVGSGRLGWRPYPANVPSG